MTMEDVEALYDAIMESELTPDPASTLTLSKPEWTAFAQGVWFDELARWRCSGWPRLCALCGGPIVPSEFGWMVREINGEHELVHIRCLK
jgi:hypothetical protein